MRWDMSGGEEVCYSIDSKECLNTEDLGGVH